MRQHFVYVSPLKRESLGLIQGPFIVVLRDLSKINLVMHHIPLLSENR